MYNSPGSGRSPEMEISAKRLEHAKGLMERVTSASV
jgi:hypothetical protein